jgi:predicted alpha/beta hydrolase family esterase
MKRVIIIHCWEGYPEYCWYPYTKKKLEALGFEVSVPEFPDTETPLLSKWLLKLKEVIREPDEDLYLIGHSLGCITILRYLESLSDSQKIGGAVFVAGFTDYLGFDEIKSFFTDPINFDEIKKHCPKFVAIHSDNDPYVSLKNGDIFKDKLGAELIIKHKASHFSGEIENEESCVELPDVIDVVTKLSK